MGCHKYDRLMTSQQKSFHMDDNCIDDDATEFGGEYCDSEENVDENEVTEEYEDAEPLPYTATPSSSSQSSERSKASTSSKEVSVPSRKAVSHENVDEDEDEVEEEYEDAVPHTNVRTTADELTKKNLDLT